MAKKSKSKSKRQSFPPAPKTEPTTITPPRPYKRPVKWELVILFLVITIGGTYLAIAMRPTRVPQFTYELINTYPHDEQAFTQGLIFEEGKLWESTGRYGESTIRQVDLETGKVLKQTKLPDHFFGEGCTRWKDRIIQLTWKEEKILVYDLELNKISEHDYDGHGWGLTTDGKSLIVSDGTSTLHFLDPETFEETHSITVRDDRRRISSLNELEFINGRILANVWKSDYLYEIDPTNGHVKSVIDLTGLWPSRERPRDGLLNGIAFHDTNGSLLVTGKLCSKIYEIQRKPK